jgi:glutathione peroxidase-family protein
MKQIQPEYTEKGVRYMMCNCGTYISVGETATNVVCGTCTNRNMMMKFPELHEGKPKRKTTGRPVGWHFMKEFVDKDGNVFHKGKEQPKLKGTLSPTIVKPKKKPAKRRTKEEILLARHEKKKKVLKKAKKELNDKLKG